MELIVIALMLLLPLFLRDTVLAKMGSLPIGSYNYSLLPIIIILSLRIIIQFLYAGSSWYFGHLLKGHYFLIYLWYELPIFVIIFFWPFYKLIVIDILKNGFTNNLLVYTAGMKEKIFVGLKEFGFGILALVAYALILIGIESLLQYQNIPIKEDDFRNSLIKLSGSKLLAGLFMLDDVLLFPLAEELFFRGYLYNALKERFSPKKGMIASALIFGFYHQDISMLVPIFVLGILLARGYERTKSLISPFITHILYNLVFSYGAKLI